MIIVALQHFKEIIMKQFEDLVKNPQEAFQKEVEAQKKLAEEYNASHVALGQKLAQEVQGAVQKTPYDWQSVVGACTEYQKGVLDVNTKAFQKGFQYWADLAKNFTPKV